MRHLEICRQERQVTKYRFKRRFKQKTGNRYYKFNKLEAQESTLQTIYQVRPNGAVKVSMHFVPGNKALPEMPRLGMRMILPAEYDVMTWLGRGPQENYADRKTGYPIGLYTATVWEQFHPYVRAQETGNKTDVRWVALRK